MTKILKETIYSRLEETVNSRGCRIISKKWKLDIYTMAKKYHDEMYSQVELDHPFDVEVIICDYEELGKLGEFRNPMNGLVVNISHQKLESRMMAVDKFREKERKKALKITTIISLRKYHITLPDELIHKILYQIL